MRALLHPREVMRERQRDKEEWVERQRDKEKWVERKRENRMGQKQLGNYRGNKI